jgi:osmotically-inducible protein OsmY
MSTTMTKTDSQIKSDVLSELKWDAAVDETEIGVQVKNGIVTLTGSIDAYPKRLAVVDAAHRVFGVLDVVDDLKVRIPAVWQRTDEDVARAVRLALKWDVLVPDDRITSTVSGGLVTLQGHVDTWAQRQDAQRAIQRLTGVFGVNNQIVVSAPEVAPDEIRRQIEAALERQAEREARRIGVSVREGVVTVSGTIRSWGERHALEQVIRHTPGVRRVIDETTVDPYQ